MIVFQLCCLVCSFGWKEFKRNCYLYVKGARSWSAASAYCRVSLNPSTREVEIYVDHRTISINVVVCLQNEGGKLAAALTTTTYATLIPSWSTATEVWSYKQESDQCVSRTYGGVESKSCSLHLPFLCAVTLFGIALVT